MQNEKLLNSILQFVETYLQQEEVYENINQQIRKNVKDDFAPFLHIGNSQVIDKMFNVFETILQSDIISYFVFECQSMKNGGRIETEYGYKYSLKTVDDLRKYLVKELEIFKS